MIEKKSIQSTTGTRYNIAQVFSQNIFYNSSKTETTPFVFNVPQYSTIGGTLNYYTQDSLAIFTNIVKPFIRFDFSENTASFGSDVQITHNIYRVDWETYGVVQSGLNADSNDTIQSETITTETIEEVDEVTGEVKKKIITSTKGEVNKTIKSSKKQIHGETSRFSTSIIEPTIDDIQTQLNTPIYSITATTTGITTNIYDFEIGQYVKDTGDFKKELFRNKDQYIIDTNFIFNVNSTPGLTDLLINKDGNIFQENYKNSTPTETVTENFIIDRGEFQGLEFKHAEYFTYLEVPDKPIFEYPTPTGGTITTFYSRNILV